MHRAFQSFPRYRRSSGYRKELRRDAHPSREIRRSEVLRNAFFWSMTMSPSDPTGDRVRSGPATQSSFPFSACWKTAGKLRRHGEADTCTAVSRPTLGVLGACHARGRPRNRLPAARRILRRTRVETWGEVV